MVVQVSVLVVQVSVLVVLLVMLLQASGGWVQVLLGVVDPLESSEKTRR